MEEKQRGIKGQKEQFEQFALDAHPLGELLLTQYHAVNGRHDGDGPQSQQYLKFRCHSHSPHDADLQSENVEEEYSHIKGQKEHLGQLALHAHPVKERILAQHDAVDDGDDGDGA